MAEIVIPDGVLKDGLKLAGRTSALNWQWGDWALTAMAPAGSARRLSGSSWNFGGDPRGLTVRR